LKIFNSYNIQVYLTPQDFVRLTYQNTMGLTNSFMNKTEGNGNTSESGIPHESLANRFY